MSLSHSAGNEWLDNPHTRLKFSLQVCLSPNYVCLPTTSFPTTSFPFFFLSVSQLHVFPFFLAVRKWAQQRSDVRLYKSYDYLCYSMNNTVSLLSHCRNARGLSTYSTIHFFQLDTKIFLQYSTYTKHKKHNN